MIPPLREYPSARFESTVNFVPSITAIVRDYDLVRPVKRTIHSRVLPVDRGSTLSIVNGNRWSLREVTWAR